VSITGVDNVTQANFGQSGDAPLTALGIPCTSDMTAAASVVFPKRTAAIHKAASAWGALPLSLVGRSLVAKQVLANSLCYHASFLLVPPQFLQELQQTVTTYIARSARPEDVTITTRGRPSLLPKIGIGCLPRTMGGMALPDLPNQVTAMQAKVLAVCFSPGNQPWKRLMMHSLARAAPFPGWSCAWVVTCMPLPASPALTLRMHALVTAFRGAGLEPIPEEADCFPLRALLLMPLYFNGHLRASNGQHFQPPTPLPPGWPCTLSQLAACPLSQQQLPQLQPVVQAMPPRWRQAMALAAGDGAALAAFDTWWVTADGRSAKHLLPDGQLQLLDVMSSGWMQAAPTGVQHDEHTNWLPACTVRVPKPRNRWTEEELAAYSAAAADQRRCLQPMMDRMLGAWQDISVYPSAWGHAGVPLHMYDSSIVRAAMTAKATAEAVQRHMSDYQPGKPLRPRLWTDPARTSASGLTALEQQWAASSAPRSEWNVQQPFWMDLRRPSRQRRPPRNRDAPSQPAQQAQQPPATPAGGPNTAPPSQTQPRNQAQSPQPSPQQDAPSQPPQPQLPAQQDAPSQPPQMPQASGTAAAPPPGTAAQPAATVPTGQPAAAAGGDSPYPQLAKYWGDLWDLPVDNSVKVFAYRLLHAAIPCKAMVSHKQHRGPRQAFCDRCQQANAGASRILPLETYTHLFVQCPTYRTAVLWLLDLWQALTGYLPPCSAEVLVADVLEAWPDAPQGAQRAVWSALRLTVLYHIWEARCSADSTKQNGPAVVRATIHAIRGAMLLQYNRSYRRQQMAHMLPSSVLSMRRLEPAVDTFSVWLSSGLCRLDGAEDDGRNVPPRSQPGDGQRLVILLTESHPVPVPTASS
jgi:hypothetical protein